MKKRIILVLALFTLVVVSLFSQEKKIEKTYKLKSSDIEVKGMLKQYIKVVDGVYDVTFKPDGGFSYDITTTIKFELKKTCSVEDLIEKIKLYFPDEGWNGFYRINEPKSFCLCFFSSDYNESLILQNSYAAFASFLECEPGETAVFSFRDFILDNGPLPNDTDATALGIWSIDTTLAPY